jgi:hypothetical protein
MKNSITLHLCGSEVVTANYMLAEVFRELEGMVTVVLSPAILTVTMLS